jgi:hypothetical protein
LSICHISTSARVAGLAAAADIMVGFATIADYLLSQLAHQSSDLVRLNSDNLLFCHERLRQNYQTTSNPPWMASPPSRAASPVLVPDG